MSVVQSRPGVRAPLTGAGKRAMPFWSSLSRVRRIIKNVPAYHGFVPHEVSWDEFCGTWVPALIADGMLAGLNWSGPNAVGYDLEPERAMRNVQALIDNPPQATPPSAADG